MFCHDAQSMMHAYLDGELQAPTVLQYEEHVRECSACSRMLAEQKELQTAMKSNALYYKAPVSFGQRLRASLRQQNISPGRPFPWQWVAAAACLVLCVGVGLLLARVGLESSHHERLAQEVVSAHIRSLQVDKKRLVDVRSSDRHEVKPWFAIKLDFAPPVPDMTKRDFTLVGGRMDYLDGRPVAALVYQRRQHLINVFLWPDRDKKDTRARRETHQGFQLISWSAAGMKGWAVSDLNAPELEELVHGLN
jgi:anti-sigma factor RsiW